MIYIYHIQLPYVLTSAPCHPPNFAASPLEFTLSGLSGATLSAVILAASLPNQELLSDI